MELTILYLSLLLGANAGFLVKKATERKTDENVGYIILGTLSLLIAVMIFIVITFDTESRLERCESVCNDTIIEGEVGDEND